MSSRRLIDVIVVSLILRQKCLAFDPVTVAAGAQAVSGIMQGLEKADKVADIGFSLGDLMSELGVAPESEGEMKDAVSRLERLNSKAKDLQWTKEDIRNALDYDLKRAVTLSEKVRALRNLISASKKVATVIGMRPKAAERAARVQELRVNSMILDELQSIRRAQFLAYLEDREKKARRDIFIQEIIEQERGPLSVGGASRMKAGRP